ncbi:MAG: hypothetical protein VW838_08285, partial [Paracoccaceae bacterium]
LKIFTKKHRPRLGKYVRLWRLGVKPQHIVVERSFPVRASLRCQQLVGCKQASPDRPLPFMSPFDTK